MNKLTKEDVIHVASLAKIKISPSEIADYEIKLNNMLNDLNKIIEVEIADDIMYTATDNINMFDDDEIKKMLTNEEVLKNAPQKESGFIVVGGVLSD